MGYIRVYIGIMEKKMETIGFRLKHYSGAVERLSCEACGFGAIRLLKIWGFQSLEAYDFGFTVHSLLLLEFRGEHPKALH